MGPASVKRALVVDDYPDAADLLCEMIAEAGFDCDAALSDSAAYQALANGRSYSCLVVDVNLGAGTTGYDVARLGRQMHPQLGVIYVSGEVSDSSFRAFGVPGSHFLEKPVEPAALWKALRRAGRTL